MNKKKLALVAIPASVPLLAQAQSDLDTVVTGIGTQTTTIVGAMATVAVSALAVFGLIVGVRYVIRIFKAVK